MRALACGLVIVGLACGLVLTTGACGSGGTSTTADPLATWAGPYFLFAFSGEKGMPNVGRSLWGTVSSDGAGGFNGTVLDNENGVIGAPTPIGPGFTYTVDGADRMTWLLGGVPAFQGGVTSDGAAACLGSVAMTDPFVFLLLRRAGVFSTAGLTGSFHYLAFFHNVMGGIDGTNWGTLTFDGMGGLSQSGGMSNIDGGIGLLLNTNETYSVAPDGTLSFTLALGTQNHQGGILEGGNVILAAGGTTGGGSMLLVLARKGAGLTNAVFSGSYHSVSLISANSGSPQWASATRTATADGAGTIDVAVGTVNSDDTIGPTTAFSDMYTVAPDGALSVGGGAVVGGISPDGRVAFFGGGTGGGDAPQMHVLFR